MLAFDLLLAVQAQRGLGQDFEAFRIDTSSAAFTDPIGSSASHLQGTFDRFEFVP